MARGFNGTSDQIAITSSALIVPTCVSGVSGTFTISCWINPAGSGLRSPLGCPGSGVTVRVNASNKVELIHTGVTIVITTTAAITNGVWTHYAVTVAGGGINIFTYLNGVQDNNTSPGITCGQPTGYFFGQEISTDFYNGSLADFATWNGVISVGEIAALAAGARPGNIRSQSLLSWFPLNGVSSPEPDFSGNAYTGTLTGTANAFGPPLMQFTPRWHRYNGLMVPIAGLSWIVNRRNKLMKC